MVKCDDRSWLRRGQQSSVPPVPHFCTQIEHRRSDYLSAVVCYGLSIRSVIGRSASSMSSIPHIGDANMASLDWSTRARADTSSTFKEEWEETMSKKSIVRKAR